MSEGAPQSPAENELPIEIFSDDEIEKLKDENKRYRALEIKKLLDKIRAVEAGLETELDENARQLRSILKRHLGAISTQSSTQTTSQDDPDNSDQDTKTKSN